MPGVPRRDWQSAATDLGWLGAPTLGAIHISCAEALEVNHFVTADEVVASWAAIRGLNVVQLK